MVTPSDRDSDRDDIPTQTSGAPLQLPGVPSLETGVQLGHYEITGLLGKGGMGEVYRARDSNLGREVAIKVLPQEFVESPGARARFEREARAIAALSHPNILHIYDLGEQDGVHYAVMELLEGTTLGKRLDESGPFSVDETLAIGAEVARGLAAAHQAGFTHRDIKPDNLFLRDDGRVTILDFGLAHSVGHPKGHDNQETLPGQATSPGTVLGSLAYMSPEQARGEPVEPSSDVFSLGCVLSETLTGKSPFRRSSAAETLAATLGADPPSLLETVGGPGSAGLVGVIDRCLAKDASARYRSGTELASALEELSQPAPGVLPRSLFGRMAVAVAALALLFAAGFWWSTHDPEGTWAREEGLPRIFELTEQDEFFEAFRIARRVEEVLPGDPLLEEAWEQIGAKGTIETDPPGAELSIASMTSDEWVKLGTTPVNTHLPAGVTRARLELEGFALLEGLCCSGSIELPLFPVSAVPAGMRPLPGGANRLGLRTVPSLPGRRGNALLGKFEVTNKEFLEFVEAGAYQDPTAWPSPFIDGGQTLSFEEAMARFRDRTGQAGPASWEYGSFLEGQDDYPVQGVSWYEAEAYARFAGGVLPTVFHWSAASGTHVAGPIIDASNIETESVLPVGSTRGIGYWGHYDMAGNVREWCRNPTPDGRRFILGGGYSEPRYSFFIANAVTPMDRSLINGLRLMREIDGQPSGLEVEQPIPMVDLTDVDLDAPGPGPEFVEQWRERVAYDSLPLEATILELPRDLEDWAPRGDSGSFAVERVSFNAAYGGERMEAYLFLPEVRPNPLQAIVVFPGENLGNPRQSPGGIDRQEFYVRSGRAVVLPIYKSTFNRRDGMVGAAPDPARAQDWQAHVVMWTQDVMRTVDYLVTRNDLDPERIGYHGMSWGHWMATWVLPVEKRIRAALLRDGGAPSAYVHGLVPGTFLGRYPNSHKPLLAQVDIPVLMLNGRYDHWFPFDTTQKPFFDALGTPAANKRHHIFEDAGHSNMPLPGVVRESLVFFDRYLGPVQ